MKLTTLGITFGYGVETVAGTKPTTFKQLKGCDSIPEINLEPEQIDVSSLEDYTSQYADGRQDTGGSWAPTFSADPENIEALGAMIEESQTAKESNKRTWFQVIIPGLDKAFFVIASPGRKIGMPSMDQNSKLTVTMSLTINEYFGLDAKVAFETGE